MLIYARVQNRGIILDMSRNEQSIGGAGEQYAASALSSLGVEMVERIGTPVKAIPHPRIPGYYQVIWYEPVAGDHRGILPGGRSVLAETKTILNRNLQYSDLREHQPGCLSRHSELGGLSLLVWVHSTGIFVMRWPIDGFEPHKSITPERAITLALSQLPKEIE
jgi:hypothetical protein